MRSDSPNRHRLLVLIPRPLRHSADTTQTLHNSIIACKLVTVRAGHSPGLWSSDGSTELAPPSYTPALRSFRMRGTDMPVTPEAIRSRFLAYHAVWLVRGEAERGGDDPEVQ